MSKKLFTAKEIPIFYHEPRVDKNTFLTMQTEKASIPKYKDVKDKLPIPVWQGREDAIDCYYKAWSLAFSNLKKANKKARFVSNYIDTAFNGYLFMWDSSFIVMFGKYASRFFNFQKTLDNFYSHQLRDGYIPRQISPMTYGAKWSRDDPVSTGPNILAWAEWEYFLSTGDVERLSNVFDALCGYHNWLKNNRSWQDGSYWSTGWGCGMDNTPRMEACYDPRLSHGFNSWIDATAQQYLNAKILIDMAKVLKRDSEMAIYLEELELLENIINNKMWDEKTQFYYDTNRYGKVTGVKSVASYWTLISGVVPQDKVQPFVAHLDNENEFKRPNRVPTLSYDHPEYCKEGGYWKGAIWAPTNYMVLNGLHKYGFDKLAFEIAKDYVNNVVEVYKNRGTLYENYAPEKADKGDSSKPDFVGWTGLAPISVMFEYLFGIHPNNSNNVIDWKINLTEEHGIKQYPFGDATVDLVCQARSSQDEEPVIKLTSNKPVTLKIEWNGQTKTYKDVTKI